MAFKVKQARNKKNEFRHLILKKNYQTSISRDWVMIIVISDSSGL